MKGRVLLISVSKEKLHKLEFVKPIEDILKKEGANYFIRDYKEIKKEDLEKSSKIIICGTSLADNKFTENLDKFSWIKSFNKPLFGICAGMQIIGLIYGGNLKEKTEIGFYNEKLTKGFFGFNGVVNVYHLHNKYVCFSKLKDFKIFNQGEISQAVKHKDKEIYGTLFHPEVRNKGIIEGFIHL